MAAAASGLAAMAPILHGLRRELAQSYSVILQAWPMSSVRSIRPMPSHIAQDRARSVSSSGLNCSLQRSQKSSSSRSSVCSLANRAANSAATRSCGL